MNKIYGHKASLLSHIYTHSFFQPRRGYRTTVKDAKFPHKFPLISLHSQWKMKIYFHLFLSLNNKRFSLQFMFFNLKFYCTYTHNFKRLCGIYHKFIFIFIKKNFKLDSKNSNLIFMENMSLLISFDIHSCHEF